ncbi:MAG TPA: sodium/proton-translocating pyrophosphatase, partial [Oligoflexia bacterium]|nr:sodium/proton-translocating pyrophosphatase [Oligoflexia bacterium]
FSPLRTLLASAVIAGSFLGAALVVCAEFVNPQFFSFFSLRPSDMSADPAARLVIAGLRGIALPLLALGVMIIVANNCSGLYGVCLAANGLLLTVVHGLCARSTTADAEYTGPAASRDHDNSPTGRAGMLRRGGWKVPTTMCSTLAGFVLFAAYTVVVSGGVDVNIVEADCLVGIFFGVATAALFASLVISAFVRAASSAAADPASLVRSAFHELVVPGLVALLVPLLVALLGTQSLGGMVAGVIIGSFLLALFVGALGGEMETSFMGTDAQSESSQNMTVGVMLVDTVPPAMNVLAKLIAGFALVLAPVL